MKGVVRSFVSEKRYGFVDGEDGQNYFVHINDVSGSNSLTQGQTVEFEPTLTPKGLSARKVKAGSVPEAIYVDPDKFIMTKSDHVKGCEIISIVRENLWGESNDPNEAREALKGVAQRSGANAVICMNLNKYTQSDACSNYKYTMHRYYGHAVVVKRIEYTSDPVKIVQSKANLGWGQSLNFDCEAGVTSLVRPPAYIFYPLLIYFWIKTALKILSILSAYTLGRCLGIKKNTLNRILKRIVKRTSNNMLKQA